LDIVAPNDCRSSPKIDSGQWHILIQQDRIPEEPLGHFYQKLASVAFSTLTFCRVFGRFCGGCSLQYPFLVLIDASIFVAFCIQPINTMARLLPRCISPLQSKKMSQKAASTQLRLAPYPPPGPTPKKIKEREEEREKER
jgi:hypothetical protein